MFTAVIRCCLSINKLIREKHFIKCPPAWYGKRTAQLLSPRVCTYLRFTKQINLPSNIKINISPWASYAILYPSKKNVNCFSELVCRVGIKCQFPLDH